MTTAPTTKKRPTWATYVAVGMFIAGFGAVLLAIGFLTGPLLIGIGAGVLCIGVAQALFGGFGYFISLHR